jgi:hypothetical protein
MSRSEYQGENLHFQSTFAFLDNKVNPNFSGENPLDEYMKCALVMFASIRRFHPKAELTFVTNKPLPSVWLNKFNDIGCVNRVLPFNFNPPEGFIKTFQGSLFLLDLLANLEGNKLNIVLDPDIVCVAQLPKEFAAQFEDQVGVLDLGFHPAQIANGLSPIQQRDYQVRNSHPAPHLRHFGGELYVIPESKSVWLKNELQDLWRLNLDRFKSNDTYLITEEHILNFVFGKSKTIDLSGIGNRIWTTSKYRLIPKGVLNLVFWHLPSEKGFGFSALYSSMHSPDSWFFEADPESFKHKVAKTMSIAGWGTYIRGKRLVKRLGMSVSAAFVATIPRDKVR